MSTTTEAPLRIGIIGGSGLYNMKDVQFVKEVSIDTPFGKPSDNYLIGNLHGIELVFLARHARGHKVNPSLVNYRANIYGMKVLGVQWIIAVSAVGSLREEIVPGHIVLIDQFIDRTSKRPHTFFEDGIVAHVSFAHPICEVLRGYLVESAKEAGATIHNGGTYVNMEGPAFSTVSESKLYRSWGASVIGMTTLTEAKLAREAEISYGVIAMATDYDCWKEDHGAVTVDEVMKTMQQNALLAQQIVSKCILKIAAHKGKVPQSDALAMAIMTDPSLIPLKTKRALAPLIHKYIPVPADNTNTTVTLALAGVALSAVIAAKYFW